MPWKGRLKAKFGKKDPPTSSPVEAPPTSTPHARTAPDPATSLPSLPARLWNQAYDQAKTSDPSTVDAYEKILTIPLSEKDAPASTPPHSADLASQQTQIAQDAGKRWMQMQQLVQNGLRRTEKDAKVKQGVEEGIQAAMAVKEVVDKAIQASPEAAVAWVGVCFALEILMNPLTQASSNRQGIAYVVSRMEWYWNLSSLLLEENMTEGYSPSLREELEKAVTQLYAKLLLYQMKSVCYYHRGRLSVFARDLIKLDNWDGELSDIQAAEAAVQTDSAQYNTLAIRTRLGAIAEAAKSQNAKLDSISSAIREQTKQQERMHETSADNKCLADLHLTDPRDDKKRIEETKGGLLKDSYRWILDNPDFREWRDSPQNELLWVKADPGKGKTMLLCGIIDELQNSMGATGILSYFFCQATDSRIRSAVAVLRGLLYSLVSQQPSLISHVRKKYDHAGKTLFEDVNAWVALTEIFTSILEDPSLKSTYLIVDALDECITDLSKLADFIAKKSSASPRVKWLVSSRNWQDIEERLDKVEHKVRLSLELNAQSVSSAVGSFIRHKVFQLAESKRYDDKTRDAVLHHLSSYANDTFLWVALVCQSLDGVPRRNVMKKLNTFPPGLDSLYERMMQQINKSDDASLCKQILALAAIAYQPATLDELPTLVEQLEDVANDPKSIREIISLCGSFLTLQKDTVYFVHQSAKDFLFANTPHNIYPSGIEAAHYAIFSRSLQAMSTLHRDMYSLGKLGYPAEQIIEPNPNPLAALRYSCIYWIDHLCDWSLSASADSSADLQDGGAVHEFIRKKYLYWLEVLSLCKSLSKGVVSIAKLEALIQERADAFALIKLVQDARRFILYHKRAIESSPLQAYASALIFSPARSLIRGLFKEEEPKWVTIKPEIGDEWGACLQTLEGHSRSVQSVAFSPDGKHLASASWDKTVKIWDAATGECTQTLEGHSELVLSAAFSPDGKYLVIVSGDNPVKIWDATIGKYTEMLEVHSGWVRSAAFSPDGKYLVSASNDKTVKIWDAVTGKCIKTLEGHNDWVLSVAFSPDGKRLASASRDNTIKMWDATTGKYTEMLEAHSGWVWAVAFSPDGKHIASASEDNTIKIWDAAIGKCIETIEAHGSWVRSVAFSPDGKYLVSGSSDSTVKMWDAATGKCIETLGGHSNPVLSVAFSPDGKHLVSGSDDNTVKIWDAATGKYAEMLEAHSGWVQSVTFSPNGKYLVSASEDNTIKMWDVAIGKCIETLTGHSSSVQFVAFSPNGEHLASASNDNTVKMWDAATGKCTQTLEGHSDSVQSVAFSPDGKHLASASGDKTVKMWDAATGKCIETLGGHSNLVLSVAFSPDSKYIVSASADKTVKIWDATTGTCTQTLDGHSDRVQSVAFSPDGKHIASASGDKTVKMWDATIGKCTQTINVGIALTGISFDSAAYLLTEIGYINLLVIAVGPTDIGADVLFHDSKQPQEQRRLHYGLSLDRSWITRDGRNLLWLPSEYRPSCSVVLGRTVCIGCASGRVLVLSFSLDA